MHLQAEENSQLFFYENRYIVPKLRPEKSPDKDNKMVMMDT